MFRLKLIYLSLLGLVPLIPPVVALPGKGSAEVVVPGGVARVLLSPRDIRSNKPPPEDDLRLVLLVTSGEDVGNNEPPPPPNC